MHPRRYTHLQSQTELKPASPLLCAPSNNLYRTGLTPSTGASALSTSDMILMGESPLSPTLAARRQQLPPSTALEPSSPIMTRVPMTPLEDAGDQFRAFVVGGQPIVGGRDVNEGDQWRGEGRGCGGRREGVEEGREVKTERKGGRGNCDNQEQRDKGGKEDGDKGEASCLSKDERDPAEEYKSVPHSR
ncbi:hypothetical protein AAT19DRAFT_13755 [Rhodotorula toruloides]|uniref:Uncharacterized protein n=1 Tax=Rhodotorula toruloides TaxID=5286 RepID=A0A2T0ACG1_RHOTO|nr:hypothetical protein AAT19DRAFT_13755 [Rhodotorula toruloides]